MGLPSLDQVPTEVSNATLRSSHLWQYPLGSLFPINLRYNYFGPRQQEWTCVQPSIRNECTRLSPGAIRYIGARGCTLKLSLGIRLNRVSLRAPQACLGPRAAVQNKNGISQQSWLLRIGSLTGITTSGKCVGLRRRIWCREDQGSVEARDALVRLLLFVFLVLR